jgi:DNA-binding response OmpR family regulator
MRLLVVEDDMVYLALLRAVLLETTDFEVTEAHSLKEARFALAAEPAPDCILLDLFLPDSEGRQTIQGVRAAAGTVPIVVLTAHGHELAAAAAIRAGASEYLLKTHVSPSLLARVLTQTVRRAATFTDAYAALADLRRYLSPVPPEPSL